jgi:DNA polymerase-1
MSKKILIIDSNALIHRAYHALPPFTTKEGVLVNAVYGYITTLKNAIDRIEPDYIVATFDLPGKTFRHHRFEAYKANREKAPDDLYQQIPLVKQFLNSCDIPIYQKEGFEADDVIGSISNQLNHQAKLEKYIVTGDKDTLQLVNDNTKVFTLGRGITDPVLFDEKKVVEKFKIKPDQVVDYKALRGDPSDNIPGVAGVGDKTATDLILEFGSLENIYNNLDKIKSKAVRAKLEKDKDKAFLSQELAEIKQDIEMDFDLEKTQKKDFCNEKFKRFLISLEFKSLLKRFFPAENNKTQEAFKIEGYRDVQNKSEWEKFKKKVQKIGKIGIYFNQNEQGKVDKIGATLLLEKKFENYCLKGKVIENFADILRDEKVLKIGYDLKRGLREFVIKARREKREFINNFFDIQLLAYLIKSGANNKLEKLIFEEFGEELKNVTTKKGQASLLIDNSAGEEKEIIEKVVWIFRLYQEYLDKIVSISQEQKKKSEVKGDLKNLLEKLENPLTKILAEMEAWGIEVDGKILEEISQTAQSEIDELEKEIFSLAGEEFNINSPSQLAKILYEKLEIPTENIKKGKTGFSTDANQLKKMKDLHPIILKIERYREIFKLKTTYTDSLPKIIEKDGRIHTTFNQTVTATGRLSSSDPNLQNIPKKGKFAKRIRSAFVAPRGKKLVALDYSQVDLRVAAHVSGDAKMIEVFKNNRDIHRATAAWVNGVDLEEITKEQRSEAKSLNFGVLYGMGTYGFMQDSGVSRERAEFFIEQYMKNFSDLKNYLEKTKEFARENGFVETEMGRRRYVKGINASNFQLRNAAERIAINLPIQGLAADIMKKAMIDVEEKVLNKYENQEVKMILQIHDELVFEVDEKLVDEFIAEVKPVMEETYRLKVPLKVEAVVGENWSEL